MAQLLYWFIEWLLGKLSLGEIIFLGLLFLLLLVAVIGMLIHIL